MSIVVPVGIILLGFVLGLISYALIESGPRTVRGAWLVLDDPTDEQDER